MIEEIKVAELFAGVGGFRLGLDGYDNPSHPEFTMPSAGPFHTVWANQWEPGRKNQFAWRCYEERFGEGSCVNEDINKVLDDYEEGTDTHGIPDEIDMLVGGFPCQDYSVAKTLSQAGGIEGKKGVLWWDIYRLLKLKSPHLVLLENVDRLLKSPASQRGRDFAIMLSCFASLGYSVEWRVVNAADYGAPQKRKRVYIFAERGAEWNPSARLGDGVMASALPIKNVEAIDRFDISDDPYDVSESFGKGDKVSRFQLGGIMSRCHIATARVEADYAGDYDTLGDVVVPDSEVPDEFFVPDSELSKWKYQKGSKKLSRTTSAGFTYNYSEGAMSYPDLLTNPARTILTSEGGRGASRMKHIIIGDSGRHRRLVPDELDQIQTFPKGWTRGMTDGQRAFCMGNALVVRIVNLIGAEIARRASSE